MPATAADPEAAGAFYLAKQWHYGRLRRRNIPGAAWFRFQANLAAARILGRLAPRAGDVELIEEFLSALAANAKMNLHVIVPYGTNNHHIAEAIVKALGKTLRQAVELDPRETSVPSTKGML